MKSLKSKVKSRKMKVESKKKKRLLKSGTGFAIMLVAAIVLEGIACLQYFYSQAATKQEAEKRARAELRAAELEINVATAELEAAAKMLTNMAELSLDYPDGIHTCTRTLLETLDNVESAGVAFIPDYYPSKGHWYEVCSSRVGTGDSASIFTRQIGGAHHDYFQSEWFRNGLTIDSCWWSEPYLDDAGAKTMVVSCSHPVRDKTGKVVAVVCIDLSINRLHRVSEYLQVYPDSYYSIRSSSGMDIVARPDTAQGRKYIIFDKEIDATGWKLSIIIPEDVLYADLRKVGFITSILMFLGLALLAFILYRAAKTAERLISSNAENERMEGELEVAQTIQMAMLPKVFPPFADRLDLNIYGMVNPAKEVGGDLYDFYVRHDKLFFCIGDVAGKGVPAALVMATTRSLFRSVTAHEERADAIVTEMNNSLADANDQNMFITLFVGVLDLSSGSLEYCNAGHNAPVIMRMDGGEGCAMELLDVLPNLPVGIAAEYAYQSQQTALSCNDLLFLYTDGLTEAENRAHEQYGEARMMDTLQRVFFRRPRGIIDAVQADVEQFVGTAQQSDDLTMLAIRYQQPAIIMRNDIQQIPTLAEWVEWLHVPEELNMPINLALEEAVTNVMLYAYPQNKSGQVLVESWRTNGSIYFTISDSGIPFDPTVQQEADITLSAEERAIGGLGIHLVRQLMDEIEYERTDGKNILTLSKKL